MLISISIYQNCSFRYLLFFGDHMAIFVVSAWRTIISEDSEEFKAFHGDGQNVSQNYLFLASSHSTLEKKYVQTS